VRFANVRINLQNFCKPILGQDNVYINPKVPSLGTPPNGGDSWLFVVEIIELLKSN
jgi:hypothetical protein